MSSSSTRLPTPEGPGSLSGAPNLPTGFTDTFTSWYIDTSEVRLHAVIGGDGPPLLLVHGWPQTWYLPPRHFDCEGTSKKEVRKRISPKWGKKGQKSM